MSAAPERPRLLALADRLGILPSYRDVEAVEHATSDATRVALIAAMGHDAATEDAAAHALAALDAAERERLVAPARVVRAAEARTLAVRVRVPEAARAGAARRATVRVALREEGRRERLVDRALSLGERPDGEGGAADAERTPSPDGTPHAGHASAGAAGADVVVALDAPLDLGYHVLRATVSWREGRRAHARHGEQALIVVPDRCPAPVGRAARAFGICASLYSVRSARNWGAGDLTDLGDLLAWAGEVGGAFVGINPLHALRNAGWEIGPYYPVSRLFRNALYIDIEAVPEWRASDEARALAGGTAFQAEIAAARTAPFVDYERVARLKRAALEALHRAFAVRERGRASERGRAYARFLAEQGEPLRDFATFVAIEEALAREPGEAGAGARSGGWRAWPAPLRDARSPEVRAFRDAHPEAIDFHCYAQFELDRQLAAAARRARDAGLAIGVYQDLAVGTAPGGSDPWAFADLFVAGASLGAPPDPLGPTGQDWGLPPIDPRRLAERGYDYWIRLVRGALAHSGALRVDHVMGLLRQFWIPAGRPASEGAYVAYPADDLFGILALESARAGAIVIGEDLGTVPDGFAERLARWGVLSSRVLTFEREADGAFRPSAHISDRALVSANTHDLAPLAGWWAGRDLELRRDVGQIATDETLRAALGARAAERRSLLSRLAAERIVPPGAEPPSPAHLAAAVHAFLCRSGAPLVGIALDDLAGEVDPINIPGTRLDQYPSWSRRARLPIEALRADAAVALALSGASARAAPR